MTGLDPVIQRNRASRLDGRLKGGHGGSGMKKIVPPAGFAARALGFALRAPRG
jgi:hypothetical protein